MIKISILLLFQNQKKLTQMWPFTSILSCRVCFNEYYQDAFLDQTKHVDIPNYGTVSICNDCLKKTNLLEKLESSGKQFVYIGVWKTFSLFKKITWVNK